MICREIQELFAEYWDLPEDDPVRAAVDKHVAECRACSEEFQIWQEAAQMIKSEIVPLARPEPANVAQTVMNRIYADESWRIPIPDRTYRISYRMRRILTALVSFFMAMFILSIFYAMVSGANPSENAGGQSLAEMFPVDTIQDGHSIKAKSVILDGVPVASISAPAVIKLEPPDRPHYFLGFSIFGMIFTLLTMNWLSRIRN
ncbi:MAG TPA: zf-HC2 domain-containing protein [Bacilli bacterium]